MDSATSYRLPGVYINICVYIAASRMFVNHFQLIYFIKDFYTIFGTPTAQSKWSS